VTSRLIALLVVAVACLAGYAGWFYSSQMRTSQQPAASAGQVSAGPLLRIVEGENTTASCAAGETLVSAFCYSLPGSSPSASGVTFRQTEPGTMTAACLSGGRKIRLICMAGGR
jgi:hypothetical protein